MDNNYINQNSDNDLMWRDLIQPPKKKVVTNERTGDELQEDKVQYFTD